MSDTLGSTAPAILKSRGVPVRLHALERNDEGRWVRRYSEDTDQPVFEQRWVQMTNAVLADVMDPVNGWGSLDAWQKALRAEPYEALQHTLALCLDWWRVLPSGAEEPDARRAGQAMVDGETDTYSSAIGGAFMLANGVRPERVGEVLAAGVKSAAQVRTRLMDRFADTAERLAREGMEAQQKALDELEASDRTGETTPTGPAPDTETSPSESGSEPGSAPGAESTSSGG